MDARSLRSDRAVCMLGRRVSFELGLSVVRLPYSSLSAAELDTCLFPSDNRDVRDQCAGFRARPRFTPGFRGVGLVSLDVSHNQLSGELPKSLINCTYLQFLNVEDNMFNETFPFWLRVLPGLQFLVLF
ncbi:hypothetical protein YC2023_002498 [Brassica napus]